MRDQVTLPLAWGVLNFIGDHTAIKVLLFWLQGEKPRESLLSSCIDDVSDRIVDIVNSPNNKTMGTATRDCCWHAMCAFKGFSTCLVIEVPFVHFGARQHGAQSSFLLE